VLHAGWLHGVATGSLLPGAGLPAPEVWTTDRLPVPIDHDAASVSGSDRALDAYLVDLVRFGLARLVDAPDDPLFLAGLAERIGPLRATNFGIVWDVRADGDVDGDPGRNSTANTRRRLFPHTDLPSRETPPGFQFLHCLENTVAGGWSTMADGAAVVARLAEVDPDAHELLSTRRWVFVNRGRGLDHRWSGPLIDRGADGALTLRAFHPVRACPDMPAEDVPRAYAALARFHRIAEAPEFLMRFPFRPGDVVGFDNRRILHGREAYEAGGVRHLRGCYLDTDDVRSTARVLAGRRTANPPANDVPNPPDIDVPDSDVPDSDVPDSDVPDSEEAMPCPTASSSPAP
jgi:gamma-butyrobetaine dioxygenase